MSTRRPCPRRRARPRDASKSSASRKCPPPRLTCCTRPLRGAEGAPGLTRGHRTAQRTYSRAEATKERVFHSRTARLARATLARGARGALKSNGALQENKNPVQLARYPIGPSMPLDTERHDGATLPRRPGAAGARLETARRPRSSPRHRHPRVRRRARR